VRLQWFKSSVVERDLYDIKTRAICQSSCDRFFFYTNYISSMQMVRKRGLMLVNLQDKESGGDAGGGAGAGAGGGGKRRKK
jgi:hypothetical protein